MISVDSTVDVKKYRNIPYQTREFCMVCEKEIRGPVVDMPEFPLSEIYVDKKVDETLAVADQGFCFCSHCGHAQLRNVIDVELQYGDNAGYSFRASESVSGRETADFFIDFFFKTVKGKTFKSIIELGCNDLYLLKKLKLHTDQLIGIDPILKGKEKEFAEDNIIAIGDFFENVELDAGMDVVICKDTLEHVSNPKRFLKKIVDKGSDDTLFFFQFPILETILEDCRFDQVFHQHLNYFSLRSLIFLLDELGCGLLNYTVNYSHWGTILIAFQKGTTNPKYRDSVAMVTAENITERYKSFEADMRETSKRMEYFRNEVIYGYGAALMLPVLSYYLKNDLSGLACIIDDDINKDGRFYINLPVQIKHSSKISNIENSVVLLTAIFSKISTRCILEKLFRLNVKHIIYCLRTI